MQAVELVERDEDGDFDGITNEMTIEDQTALIIYLAAQPRPSTKIVLARLGLLEPLSDSDRQSIRRGKRILHQVGCTSCHTLSLRIKDPRFREPSANANNRDETFPCGLNPIDELIAPTLPVSFDLTWDQPETISFKTKPVVSFDLVRSNKISEEERSSDSIAISDAMT